MIRALRRSPDGRGLRLAAVAASVLLAIACTDGDAIAPLPAEVDLARIGAAPAGFHRGMNLEPIGGPGSSPRLRLVGASLDALVQLGVDSVAVVPGFIQERLGDDAFRWQGGRSRVEADTRAVIGMARERGLRVLLKPHLWLEQRDGGLWRGDIDPEPRAWPRWSAAYRDALLGFARIGAEEGAEILSLGSELARLSTSRPEFWRGLALEARRAFPGELTYAANWYQEFERIEFWSELDYVGVDAFWPLLDGPEAPPTLDGCHARMQEVRLSLWQVSERNDRPMLLTEIGYKSSRGSLARPWRWHEDDPGEVDLDAQAIAYACAAEVLGAGAHDGWLGGAYVWNWHASRLWGGSDNSDFTPRGKPAQRILEAWFAVPGGR